MYLADSDTGTSASASSSAQERALELADISSKSGWRPRVRDGGLQTFRSCFPRILTVINLGPPPWRGDSRSMKRIRILGSQLQRERKRPALPRPGYSSGLASLAFPAADGNSSVSQLKWYILCHIWTTLWGGKMGVGFIHDKEAMPVFCSNRALFRRFIQRHLAKQRLPNTGPLSSCSHASRWDHAKWRASLEEPGHEKEGLTDEALRLQSPIWKLIRDIHTVFLPL